MDPLTDLLNGTRASGAVFNQSFLSGAWALRFLTDAPLALAVPLHGSCWVVPEGGAPARLGAGDVAVLAGGAPYVIADDPATEPDVVIHSADSCTTPRGEELSHRLASDVRTWGAAARPDGTRLLSGLYTVDGGSVPRRLLAALPPLAVVEAGLMSCPLGPTAFEEITREEPGQQALLDRVLDLVLVSALRAWFTRSSAQAPAWFLAHGDPVVGRALRLLHADPAHPWTVAALAARNGVSRASLARRFTALVGRPPMAYLREWRLALAADLLREPGMTVGAVAGRVGFASAFGLSAAFKRERGISPSEHRAGPASGPGRGRGR
ncbi:AraC family transcriptional regulator [Streptomyces sp. MP131-18]|uniref:AraC family transcriptional regulator n=1 Tax=Streptomyces sp. MP131-18 TaxID=1857892 RepID=UPI00097BF62A|nr:AraC family transcriptional regulator [Streptomyces sp. MP131-18]ONK12622.1 Regulatory protein PchR [Streptomyces sp. MP131-18]